MSRHRIALSLVSCLMGVTAGTAHADTLPSVPSTCFTYSLEAPQRSEHGFTASALHASLNGGKAKLVTGAITVNDPTGTSSPEALEKLNATAAFAALSLFTGKAACSLNTTSFHGALTAHWSTTTLTHSDHTLSIQSLSLNEQEHNKNINATLSLNGMRDSTTPLVPSQMSADLTIQSQTSTPLITINSLHATNGTNALGGHGTVQTATTPAASTVDMHISLTNVDALLAQLRQTAPARVITALTIARLMGRTDGNATEWDIGLHSGVATVNNVPLPIGNY